MKKADCEEVLSCLSELEGRLAIVEGKKDSRALKTLGVKNITKLNGKPLVEFALHVSKSHQTPNENKWKEAVILTDFDSEGRKIAARLERLLKLHKVPVNQRIRKRFMGLGRGRIEEFREDDINGKTCTDVNKVRGKG